MAKFIKALGILLFASSVFFFSCKNSSDSDSEDEGEKKEQVAVKVDHASFPLGVDKYVKIEATVTPANLENKEVTWSSDDEKVATVNEFGVVKGIAEGQALITATSVADPKKSARCEINVTQEVGQGEDNLCIEEISLDQEAFSLGVNKKYTLQTEILPKWATCQTLIWTSSDENVATVDENGTVTGAGEGENVVITAETQDGSGLQASCTVSVFTIFVDHINLESEATAYIARTLELQAEVVPNDATEQGISWSSDNEEVATVDEHGVVRGKSAGQAVITATSLDVGGDGAEGEVKSASCTVTVLPVLAESVTTKCDKPVYIDHEEQFFAEVSPIDTTDSSVTWTSSDENVATVDENGVVTGISEGAAVITATANDGSGAASSLEINVTPLKVSSVTMSADGTETYIDHEITLEATVLPEDAYDRAIVWTSSDEAVATVDQSGVVRGISEGEAVITATAKDGSGAAASCEVSVTPLKVSSIELDKSEATVRTGFTLSLEATVLPEDAYDKSLEWKSDNESVATVDQSGVVSGIADGEAVITATAKDGSGASASCAVSVFSKVLVESISLVETASIFIGGTETLQATISPSNADDQTLTWSSSNPDVATVDQSGVVTAKALGSATITAAANDEGGVSASCAVTVKPILVSGITFNPTSKTVNRGDSFIIGATVLPSNATDKTLTWSSSNTGVATVDSSGKVTANAVGEATITATAADGSGKAATCKVTVVVLATSITFNPTSKTVNRGDSFTIGATVLPKDATNKTLGWQSSDTSVATVDSSGKVTAKAKGTATITATANDGSGKSATCAVTVVVLVSNITLGDTYKELKFEDVRSSPLELFATVEPGDADNRVPEWTSSDESIAEVHPNGIVSGRYRGYVRIRKPGTVTITAAAQDGSGKSAQCQFRVTVANPIGKIEIQSDWNPSGVKIGDIKTFSAYITGQDSNKEIDWPNLTWTSTGVVEIVNVENGQGKGIYGRCSRVTVRITDYGSFMLTATAEDGSGKSAKVSHSTMPAP